MDQLEQLLTDIEGDAFGRHAGFDPLEFRLWMSPSDTADCVEEPPLDAWPEGDWAEGDRAEGDWVGGGWAVSDRGVESFTDRLNEYLDVVAFDQQRLAVDAARLARSVDAAWMFSLVSDEFLLLNPTMLESERTGWAHCTFVSEIGALLHLPDPTASRLIEESHSLVHELPGTLSALESGSISYRQAQVILTQAGTLPVEVWAAFEQELLGTCSSPVGSPPNCRTSTTPSSGAAAALVAAAALAGVEARP